MQSRRLRDHGGGPKRRRGHVFGTMIRLSAVLGVALAWACGDDGSTGPAVPVPSRVVVSPAEVRLDTRGSTAQLTAQVLARNGQPMTGAAVTWSSGSIAVATADSTGLVTALADGTTTVTATVGGITATATVTVTVAATGSAATDREALVALYEATGGQNWVNNENWLTDAPLGEWFGVTTNHEGRVVALEMAYYDRDAGQWVANNVSGPIPPELATLARMERMQFYANSVTGSIPPELGKLANLTLLDFNANDLSGPIPPELGDLANLTALLLYGNNLSGPIPPELANLGSLTWLWLGGNQLTGQVPSELGNLGSLESLYLNDNVLIGSIPPELGNLGNLTRLWLDGNQLTGQVPSELGNLGSLERLDLDHNALTGSIPSQLGNLRNLERLDLDYNALTGPIPPQLGNLGNLEWLDLDDNGLTGPIPSELGSLGNLRWLDFDNNALTGPIPPEFGNLGNLEQLDVHDNALTGPIPQSILRLDRLRYLYIGGNDGLCVPGISAFAAWLRTIEDRDDESESLCNAIDVAVLTSLFEAAGGSGWGSSGGWLDDFALDDWYGVSADSLGRVTELDLTRNGLAGRMPSTLGELARLMELRIGGNGDLAGRLPLSLKFLPLHALHYSGTGVCAPVDEPFQAWLAGIGSHEGTGAECAPLSDREALEALYEATGGPAWVHGETWLMDAPVGDWYGVEVDEQGRAVQLYLDANGLKGRIPPELGGLTHLRALSLYRNELTGPIPLELGNLADLNELWLGENGLTGPIPSELGNLTNLQMLDLRENDLTGSIPTELGNLTELWELTLAANHLTGSIPSELGNLVGLGLLDLSRNDLTGSVPAELGGLTDLWRLNLATNRLTGPIPPELGGLVNLGALFLGANELTGPVPPEVGGLTDLRHLALQLNAGLSGALPLSLLDLTALESLQAGGTNLCSPADAAFGEWLEGVPNRRVTACARAVFAGVPRPGRSVAGIRRSVDRGRGGTAAGIPDSRSARTTNGFRGCSPRSTWVPISSTSPTFPVARAFSRAELDEGSLATSSHAVVPAEVVRPGLEMVVEIDPDRTLDPALGVPTRIPETGRLGVDVRDMPLLDLTLVPFLWTQRPGLGGSPVGRRDGLRSRGTCTARADADAAAGRRADGGGTRSGSEFEQQRLRPGEPDRRDPGHGGGHRVLDGHVVGKRDGGGGARRQ